ncbi:cupin domain-containing protein, partial [Gordonibacter pamelaeae]|nr:cupin domain-containing protein [Gordonibacter pamelaeae]
GFYHRTYGAPQILTADEMPCGFIGPRPVSTAILFLLEQGQYSRLHRIRQDELWHFHLGGPLRLACIDTHGQPREVILGP